MFTLVLKDGRRISSVTASDLADFWAKEDANREAAKAKAKKKSGK